MIADVGAQEDHAAGRAHAAQVVGGFKGIGPGHFDIQEDHVRAEALGLGDEVVRRRQPAGELDVAGYGR